MAFFRSYIAPLLIVLIFAVAMLAVSARIFLPSDMMAPAPIEVPNTAVPSQDLSALAPSIPTPSDELPPGISLLLHGLQDDAA